MSIRLILEHAPTPQRFAEKIFSAGQMTIGRGDDCDWQLDDSDKYVSRKHCVITDEDGTPSLIDASSGGVFVDGSTTAVGAGNSVLLENEMRLRLGDFVIRVEMESAVRQTPPPDPVSASIFNFGPEDETPPPPQARPENLPPKFGIKPEHAERKSPFDDVKPPKPIDHDRAFDLDLAAKKPATSPWDDEPAQSAEPTSFSGGRYFDTVDDTPPPRATEVTQKEEPTREQAPAEPWPPIEIIAEPDNAGPPPVSSPAAPSSATSQAPILNSDDAAGLAALYKGMGLDPALAKDATPQELEAIGARFKEMTDGVMFLLRTRAEEKVKVRVAQTIISNADVNPLKFLASSDEAILALIRGRGDSYLSGDKAVTGAFRDLADHQVRTWQALQTALRRMIDRFDPEEIEHEIEDTGLLEKLVAGGRSAKMWQTYQERYREIAQAAEERFLGEVGADFRDAYEDERNRK